MFRFPRYKFSIQNSYQAYAQKIKSKEDVLHLERVLQKAFQIDKQLKQKTEIASKMQDGAIYKFYTPFRTILAAYQQQKTSDQLNQELIGNSIEALSKTFKAYSKLDTYHYDIDPTKLEESLEYETLYKQGLKLYDFKAMAQFVQAITDLGNYKDQEFIINKSFDLINNRDFKISQLPQFQQLIQQIFDEEQQEIKNLDEYDLLFEDFNNYIKTTSDNFLKIIHAVQELKQNYVRIINIQDKEFLKEAVLLNLEMLELEEALLELNIISPQDVIKQNESPSLDDAINFILDGKQNQKELFEKIVNIKVNKLIVNQNFIDQEQDTSELVLALTNLANRSTERIFDQNYIKIKEMFVTLFDLLNKKSNQNWLNLFFAYSKIGLDQQAQQFLQKIDRSNLNQDQKIKLIDGLIEINLSSQIGDLTQNIEITHLNNDQLVILAIAQSLQGQFSDLIKFELEHRYLNIQAQNDLSYQTLYLLKDLAYIFNNESILPFKLKIEESEVFQQILKVFPKSFSIVDKGLYPQIMGRIHLVNSNFCLSNGRLNGYAQNRVNILRCKHLTVNQFVGVKQEQIKELIQNSFDITDSQKELFVKISELLNNLQEELKPAAENLTEINFQNINNLNLEYCIKKTRATLNNYYNTNFENQKNYLGQLLRAQLLELDHRASSLGKQLNLKQLLNQIPIKQFTIPKWFGAHQSQQLIQANDSLDGFKASLIDETFLFGEYCPYDDIRERLSAQGVIVRQASNIIYRNAINIPNHKTVRKQIISSYPLGWREHAKYQDEQSQKEIDELYEFLALQQKESNIDRNDLFAINLLNLKAELKLKPITQIVDWVFGLDVWDQLLDSKLTSINSKTHGIHLQRSASGFLKAQLAKKHASKTVDFLEHTSQQNEAIDNLIQYRQQILDQMYEDVRNKKLNKSEAQTVARKVDEIFTKKVQDFKNQLRQHHSSPYFQKRVNYIDIQMTQSDINKFKVNEYPESQDPDLLVVNQQQWLTVKRSRAEDKLLTYRILLKQQKGEKITDKEKQFLNKLSLYEPQVSVTHFKIQDLSQDDKQKLQQMVHSQLQEFPDYTLSDLILELSEIFDNQLFREILTKKFYNSNGLQYQIQRTASNLALRLREEQIYKDQRSLNAQQLDDLKKIVETVSINTWPDKSQRDINDAQNYQIITKLNQTEGQLESIYGWLSAKYDEQKIDVRLARGDDIQIWNAVFTIPYQKATSKDLHEIVEQLLQRFYICKYHAPPIFRRVIMLILTHPQTSELDKQLIASYSQHLQLSIPFNSADVLDLAKPYQQLPEYIDDMHYPYGEKLWQ
ncbi:hypothetical protein pb186bvf_002310 [Paramecium bursaria]